MDPDSSPFPVSRHPGLVGAAASFRATVRRVRAEQAVERVRRLMERAQWVVEVAEQLLAARRVAVPEAN